MIILAHDGSLYGDWVARYAIRFASAEPDHTLLLLHVLDGRIDPQLAAARFKTLTGQAEAAAVTLHCELLPLGKSVYRTLRQATPHDPQALLVCGTRVKPRRQAFLTGSVAESLLRTHQCPVLAVRVVQPGLLGLPHDLLMPLAGHRDGFARLWPIFRRCTAQVRRAYFLHAIPVPALSQAYSTPGRQAQMRQAGESFLDHFIAELYERIPTPGFHIERRVLITSDWAHQILVDASRLKTQLLLLGASERSLAHRVFHGQALERILRDTPCDVGIYRGP